MKKIVLVLLLFSMPWLSSGCDEHATPVALVVDEGGNPIPKAEVVCDVPNERIPSGSAQDNGRFVVPYTRGDVKCTFSKEGYESVTHVFILRKPRTLDEPERIVLKKAA